MKSYLLLVIGFAICCNTYGQKHDAIYFNPKDSAENYYIAVLPEVAKPKGLLILMPGAFQTPENALQQTNLPQLAAKQGIVTIMPSLVKGIYAFGIDSLSQQSLHEQIQHATKKYQLQGKEIYIGGFSLGGSAAVKYAEMAVMNNYTEKPKAVFAIDPPLDFERYYNAAQRIVRLSQPQQANQEITYMISKIETEMNGTPTSAIANYYKISPYSYSDATQQAVRLLKDIPVMLITEPDAEWWLRERGYDYSMMNCTDQVGMINELQRMGNKNAVLVTTHNKGYREPGHNRHPHSYSIADNEALLKWLLSMK